MNAQKLHYGRIICSLIGVAVFAKICWRLSGALGSLLIGLIVTGLIALILISMFGTHGTSSK